MTRALICLALLLAQVGLAAPAPEGFRVAIVIGSNEGDEGEPPLEYAESDAVRFHQMLVDVAGVAPERAYLLIDPNAASVRKAIAEVTGRLLELKDRGPASLIVYVSSHADEQALHLAGTKLPIDELRLLVSDTAAAFRLVVIDACRNKVIARAKGGRPGPEVAISLESPARLEGTVWMTAAGEGEPAQEWTYLRGSLFTHHLLTALRGLGDLNGDGVVSLSEAYAYSFGKTVIGSVGSTAGPQRPSFDIKMSGWGEWIFSRPAALGATLVFGEELRGTIWVADERQELIAELAKGMGATRRLAVRPGRYRIVLPMGRFAEVAEINLSFGGERVLTAEDFVRVPLTRARLRGSAPIVLRPWKGSLGYALATPAVDGLGAMHAVELGLERELRAAFVRFRAGFTQGSLRSPVISVVHRELRLTLGAGATMPVGMFLLSAGAELDLTFVWQKVTRPDAEQIERLFGLREPERNVGLWGADAFASLRLPLGDRLGVGIELAAGAQRVPLWDGTIRLVPRVEGTASVWWAF